MESFGFSFDDFPGGLLKSCHYDKRIYWKASSAVNEIKYPCWVLDYCVNGGLLDCSTGFADPGIRGANTGHLYPPDQPYYQRTLHSGYDTCAHVLFTGEFPFLRRLLENPGHFLRIRDPEHVLHKLLLEIAEISIHGNSRYWKCQAKLCEILDCLNHLTPGDDGFTFQLSENSRAKETAAERAVYYLETHYRKKLTMQEIASALGVSVSSLAHHYQKEKGETVMETLLRIRIQQSLPLLASGVPLKAIAENVGFCNEFYYSHQFRKLMNISPGRWQSRQNVNKQTSGQ